MMKYEPVIGLEVHAELQTQSKMFCACPVVDATTTQPNVAVCPVCAGMPGVLPVLNTRAVEFGLRVALALECDILPVSIFARKNYFYPDLPKGYQISQYEQPLAVNGRLTIITSHGEKVVRIRRVHLEEDTGKLTHTGDCSLVDLNRAGVPLLEIVTEPDLHSAEEARVYAQALRTLLMYLEVNSGDLQKGAMRLEPNISLRIAETVPLGTRTEIKNLNSFRALERSVAFEIQRQTVVLDGGGRVVQETRGWDEPSGTTLSQRSKEEAHDYRYFPEPDLPPLVLDPAWIENVRHNLPELPATRFQRFQAQYGLKPYTAGVLVADQAVAEYYEQSLAAGEQFSPPVSPEALANLLTGEFFSLLNLSGKSLVDAPVSPAALAGLASLLARREINPAGAKSLLAEMFATGRPAPEIVQKLGLQQVSDAEQIQAWVQQVLDANPEQVQAYLNGKEPLLRWLFGQVVRLAQGRANPQGVQAELERQLKQRQS